MADKTSDVLALKDVLAGLDIEGSVISAAAPRTGRELWRGRLQGAGRHGPQNMAMLRDPAIPLLTELGMTSAPAAVCWVSYETFTRALELLQIPRTGQTYPSPDFATALTGTGWRADSR